MNVSPARSSGPIAGGTGVFAWQHDGYMMFCVGLTTEPLSCVWPSPIAWPISCSRTREKFNGCLNEAPRSAAFWKMTKPRAKA